MIVSDFANHDDDLGAHCMAVGPGCGIDLTFERIERSEDGTVSVVSVSCDSGKPTTVAVVCPATDDADMRELFGLLDDREVLAMCGSAIVLSTVVEFERAMKAVREAVLAEHLENKAAGA